MVTAETGVLAASKKWVKILVLSKRVSVLGGI